MLTVRCVVPSSLEWRPALACRLLAAVACSSKGLPPQIVLTEVIDLDSVRLEVA
jgi:hypothetical protein